MNELMENLENGVPPIQLCLHMRDFQAGKSIASNIIDEGIMGSRKIIVVVSQHFIDSAWCRFEFELAQSRFILERNANIIIIILEDVEERKTKKVFGLHKHLKKNTYLKWSRDPLMVPARWPPAQSLPKRATSSESFLNMATSSVFLPKMAATLESSPKMTTSSDILPKMAASSESLLKIAASSESPESLGPAPAHGPPSLFLYDEVWVMNELMENLENGVPPIQLCLHMRDFQAGKPIASNIIDEVIMGSRKIIVVMSQHFIDSAWCRFEFELAQSRFMMERNANIIIIILEDVEERKTKKVLGLHKHLKKNTYLKWSRDPLSNMKFWIRLRKAVITTNQ
ncbi:hypothetical protein Q8A67_011003 [Cirrhinus molitorella]|uniref:TIR domain-containing protein n=1 Tax=Cirrhinus molitorella TaxID=172907 RepID=A0AA88PPV2_9TELE|nr:hypothetical protein Q8A67_011003 [Cirrhinus molitorella]